jgi:hypothetical protein
MNWFKRGPGWFGGIYLSVTMLAGGMMGVFGGGELAHSELSKSRKYGMGIGLLEVPLVGSFMILGGWVGAVTGPLLPVILASRVWYHVNKDE